MTLHLLAHTKSTTLCSSSYSRASNLSVSMDYSTRGQHCATGNRIWVWNDMTRRGRQKALLFSMHTDCCTGRVCLKFGF